MNSRVVLQGLEFFGRHGVFAAEAELGARFVVDAELHYPFVDLDDDLSGAVNYAEAYALISRTVTQERFDLIETLAATLARQLLAEFARLEAVTVRVHKPAAPVAGIFRDIYAELSLERENRND
ncbi:dihydroneopterin aldolase [Deinococcus radiophilus]|uniref:7,8-dihydroneopterin aldolase n=1 Tax=Deinococcus radiophilus TaxID=32062 RepID=A0A3S0IJ65_9DEIO|nr:dihydroneopterin aldolase [Deinococcus radiophilus]RTR25230.1 dihydroneopterin aldolase [Deinococcus radiophilus]UFA50242.1 dihydroneopterin aldolase [Deinococcus radiophilus]